MALEKMHGYANSASRKEAKILVGLDTTKASIH